MNVEDLLRDAVAPREGAAPAAEARARREAMAALAGMRRRHRIRRVVTVAAGAAGIAAISAFFVFARPGADEGGSPGGAVATLPVALLERPVRPGDALPDGAASGLRGEVVTARRAGTGRRLGFHAVRTAGPEQLCLVATTERGAAAGAACNEPGVLVRVGALLFLPQRVRAGADAGFLVPDGIDRVVVGDRVAPVTGNLAVVALPGSLPRFVTLSGPATTSIRPDGGPDWPRGETDGVPSVTVPLAALGAEPAPLAPGEALRLLAPGAAPAGSVVDLRAVGPDGLPREVGYGIDATFERRVEGTWQPWYQLTHPLDPGSVDDPPAAELLRPEGNGVLSIGFSGGGPMPVRLPSVPPGTYRITKDMDGLTLHAEILVTADPVPVPGSAAALVDVGTLGNPATGPGEQRAWEARPRRGITDEGEGDTRCWVVSAPGAEGGVCAGTRRLARDGAALLTVPDQTGTEWGFLFADPGTMGTVVDGKQVPITNGVAFLGRLGTASPAIRLILRSGSERRLPAG